MTRRHRGIALPEEASTSCRASTTPYVGLPVCVLRWREDAAAAPPHDRDVAEPEPALDGPPGLMFWVDEPSEDDGRLYLDPILPDE